MDKDEIQKEYESTDISLKDLAAKHSINYQTIKSWKSRGDWGKVATSTKEVATNEKKLQPNKGAPKGNKNALGNEGGAPIGNKRAEGHGAPEGNNNAVSHGFFRKFMPDDDVTREIYDSAGTMKPIDLLWENIQIKFTAIVRAQRIMWVQGKDEMIKELKKQKFEIHSTGRGKNKELHQMVVEEEYEFQFSWDRQATFLNAQARAMGTLTSMIRQYEEMCRLGSADEEQQLRIQKLKLEVDKIANLEGDAEDELISDWVEAVMDDDYPDGEHYQEDEGIQETDTGISEES